MKPFSPKLLNSNYRILRSRFLLPLTFCLLSAAFYIPPLAPRLAIAQTINTRKVEADLLSKQGQQLLDAGRVKEAISAFEAALKLYQTLADRKKEGITLNSLGWIYLNLEQYPKALESYQQALKISQAVGDRAGEGYALNGIGGVYASLGQYPKALDYHQQALKISQAVGYRTGESRALNSIGRIYNSFGQYPKALESYQQALKISQATGDRAEEDSALIGIGEVYLNLGQYSKALDYYQQGLKIAISQAAGNRTREVETLNGIATVYYMLGQTPRSLDYHQQALKVSQAVGYRTGESRALAKIGALYYFILGQTSKGLDSFHQALKIHQAVGNRAEEGRTLSIIGGIYGNLGQTPKSLDYLQQALKISQAIKNRAEEGKILDLIGYVLVRSGQFNAAEQPLSQAISIYEQLRPGLRDSDKISFSDARRHPYKSLQEALVAQNKTTTALEVSERGRTRAFVELLATRLAGDSTPPQTIQRLSQPLSLPQIKQVARQQNATLVEYSVVGGELYIWLIRPTGQIEFRKTQYNSSTTKLQELVYGTHDVLRRGDRRSGTSSTPTSQPTNDRLNQFGAYQLRTLHQLLIEPIADLLPKNPSDRVIFIPQNELLLVPFPALLNEKGTYLIEQHTLLTAPSIQVLSFTNQNQQQLNRTPNRTALVVGNPTLPKLLEGSLVLLPAAEQEARAVAQLLKTTPMIGAAANKSAVLNQMPQARFIHLATHGLLTSNNGNAPGAIVLAPDSPNQVNDGLLTPSEILNMKLKAELVVLSACDTAQGDVTSDGIVGLSRSLISAGVPSVIVSLWAVPDAPTSELMQTFYKFLQEQPDKAQALRHAMLTTMKTHPQPRNWAAFTLIGEAE